MPVTYDYDPESNMMWTRFWGDVTNQELIDQALAVARDPRIKPGARELADFSDVEQAQILPDTLEQLVTIDCNSKDAHGVLWTAIVAPTDFSFGMARMFEALSESSGSPAKVRAFRTREAAKSWLSGLPRTLHARVAAHE